jgi:hypothetical protein
MLCEEKGIPYVYVPTKAELGAAVGIPVPTSSVAVEDAGGANEILNNVLKRLPKHEAHAEKKQEAHVEKKAEHKPAEAKPAEAAPATEGKKEKKPKKPKAKKEAPAEAPAEKKE